MILKYYTTLPWLCERTCFHPLLPRKAPQKEQSAAAEDPNRKCQYNAIQYTFIQDLEKKINKIHLEKETRS